MDQGAWKVIIYEVAKNRTQLSTQAHTHGNSHYLPSENQEPNCFKQCNIPCYPTLLSTLAKLNRCETKEYLWYPHHRVIVQTKSVNICKAF